MNGLLFENFTGKKRAEAAERAAKARFTEIMAESDDEAAAAAADECNDWEVCLDDDDDLFAAF